MNIKIKQYTFNDELQVIDALCAPTIKETRIKIAKMVVDKIEEQIAIATQALNFTSRIMSVDEFTKILNTLYNIELNENDYSQIFSLAYNKQYVTRPFVRLINTYMVIKDRLVYKNYNTSYVDVEREFLVVISSKKIYN